MIAFATGAIAAISVAAALDAPVARAMQELGFGLFIRAHMWLRDILISPGWGGCTVVVAIIVWLRHGERHRAAIFILLCGVIVSVNEIIKWMVGRIRPFKIDEAGERLAPFELQPFRFYYVKNLCFTSGHTALAFATAAALGMLWPRWRALWYLIASLVAIERFAENAHWLSDTVAGAALGIGSAYLVAWVLSTKWTLKLPTPHPISHPNSRS